MSIVRYDKFEQFDREIIEAKEKMLQKEHLLEKIRETRDTLNKEIDKRNSLESIFEKEKADVEKLEKVSFKSIIASISGNKSEKLSKEKEELIAAKMKYDECLRLCDRLNSRLVELEKKYDSIGDLEKKYWALIEEKKEKIIKMGGIKAEPVFKIMDQLAYNNSRYRELDEAIGAGERAFMDLKEVHAILDKARQYGVWDMFGGGIIATSQKHQRIREAKEAAEEAATSLNIFNMELKDVNIQADFNIRIDSGDKFVDFFFDGLWADIHVQNKINDALERSERTIDNITEIIARLKSEIEYYNKENEGLKDRLCQIIEKTR